jgi:hypothetical protein
MKQGQWSSIQRNANVRGGMTGRRKKEGERERERERENSVERPIQQRYKDPDCCSILFICH